MLDVNNVARSFSSRSTLLHAVLLTCTATPLDQLSISGSTP